MLPISVSVKHTEGFCSCVGNPGNRAHGQNPFFILQENIMGIPRYLSNKLENEISQIDYFKKKVIV